MKKILGLILELNPFHLGHEYFINEAKKIVNPDVTIAVVSSNFTMRGEPTVMDKFQKTKLLIDNNICDLVMELPFISCINSSDYFTYNSISILKDLKVTDICFGAEVDNINILYDIINILKTDQYNHILKEYLNKGFSYATSSFKAIQTITDNIDILKNYPLPNNTLAIGYLKAIEGTNITPHLIKRIDNDYYESQVNETGFSSARALRNALDNNENINKYIPIFSYNFSFYKPFVLNNNLYYLLKYRLLKEDLNNISGVNEGIENRLQNFIYLNSYEEYVRNVQTKRYQENKIKRLILNILLNIPKKMENTFSYYLRIMGMNAIGKKYINTLPKDIKNNIITSFKNNNNEIVKIELTSTKLYGIICNNNELYNEEFKVPYRKD